MCADYVGYSRICVVGTLEFGRNVFNDEPVSPLEQRIAQHLRSQLLKVPIGGQLEDEALAQDQIGLSWFILAVQREVHPQWKYESLDGVLPLIVRKTGPLELELIGNAILITDQTEVPVHLQLQLDESAERVSWPECRLGEKIDGQLKRVPYSSDAWQVRNALTVQRNLDAIDWFYVVGYGTKRH